MTHAWLWGGLIALVVGAVALDLGVHRHQRRPLTLRAAAGWSLLWIALSLGSGVRTLVERDDDRDALPDRRWVRALRRFLPIAPRYEGSRFLVGGSGGGRSGTMLLFALVVIELSDLLFAVDSIPAVLGVTSDL